MKKTLVLLLCILLTVMTVLPALADSDMDFRYAARVDTFSEDGLALFQARNGLYGYVNTEGEVSIPPTFQRASYFQDGIALVYNGALYGLIDTTGAMVADYQWPDAYPFSEGLAAVKNADGTWGYIDNTGAQVISLANYEFSGYYDYPRSFENGVAEVRATSGTVYIDRTGKECSLENAAYPSAALYTIEKVENTSNYNVYCNGTFVGKFYKDWGALTHEYIEPVQGADILWVINADDDHLYDAAANRLLMMHMDDISDVCSDGRIRVRDEMVDWFVDVTGSMAIPPVESAYDFSCGYAVVSRQCAAYDVLGNASAVTRYGYMDTNGNVFGEYEEANPFVNGYAIIKDYGKYEVISTDYFVDYWGEG